MSFMPTSSFSARHGRALPSDFVPGPFDVLCSHGVEAHRQNSKFRTTVQMHLSMYIAATSSHAKRNVIDKVINVFRQRSLNGGFVGIDPASGLYFEVGDIQARQKVSRAFATAVRNEAPKRHKRRIRCIVKPVEEPHCEVEDEMEAEMPSPPITSFTSTHVSSSFRPFDFRMTYSNRDLLGEDDVDEDDHRISFSTRDLLSEFDNNGNGISEEEPSFDILRFQSTMAAFS